MGRMGEMGNSPSSFSDPIYLNLNQHTEDKRICFLDLDTFLTDIYIHSY